MESRWPAYAAAGWAAVFAAASFYWAAGGSVGVSTLGDVSDRVPTAAVWGTGLLKLTAALLALTLVYPVRARRLWTLGVWTTGVICTLYGAANLGVRAVMALGILHTPASMHTSAADWHLMLWDPFWLLGGVLFLAAAYATRRRVGS